MKSYAVLIVLDYTDEFWGNPSLPTWRVGKPEWYFVEASSPKVASKRAIEQMRKWYSAEICNQSRVVFVETLTYQKQRAIILGFNALHDTQQKLTAAQIHMHSLMRDTYRELERFCDAQKRRRADA